MNVKKTPLFTISSTVNEYTGTEPASSSSVFPTLSAGVDRGSSVDRSQTPVSLHPVFMGEYDVNFAQDLSAYWFKPTANREETISALKYQPRGTFIIRSSNSFPGAFGLAVKVDESCASEDSVRHFLIEQTKYGVRLRGSTNEPVYSKFFLPCLVL